MCINIICIYECMYVCMYVCIQLRSAIQDAAVLGKNDRQSQRCPERSGVEKDHRPRRKMEKRFRHCFFFQEGKIINCYLVRLG